MPEALLDTPYARCIAHLGHIGPYYFAGTFSP